MSQHNKRNNRISNGFQWWIDFFTGSTKIFFRSNRFFFGCHPFKRFASWSKNHLLLLVKHWALCMQLGKPFTERFLFLQFYQLFHWKWKHLLQSRRCTQNAFDATWNFKIGFLAYEFEKTEKMWMDEEEKNPLRSEITIVLAYEGKIRIEIHVFFNSTVIVVLLFIYGSSASDSLEWACACCCRTIMILFGNSKNERKNEAFVCVCVFFHVCHLNFECFDSFLIWLLSSFPFSYSPNSLNFMNNNNSRDRILAIM